MPTAAVAEAYEFSPRGAVRMWQRNATVGRKTIATSLTPRFLEAIAYLAIMGLGLGTYLTTVDGVDYVDFIAPGVAASTVMFGAVIETTYNSFVRIHVRRVVDAVVTLSTMPMDMDAWGIDAVVTGGQKGLSSIPGVSLIAFSDRAWEALGKRPSPRPHWCFDAERAWRFWGHQQYHYTAPVPGILALHEALRLIGEETLERRFERHRVSSEALQRGIEAMGLSLFAPEPCRLNSVVGISTPAGLSPADVCGHVSRHHQVEISGSFGLPIVRIGQMGEQCREHNLFRTLHALGRTMLELGARVDLPAGVAALEQSLSENARGR